MQVECFSGGTVGSYRLSPTDTPTPSHASDHRPCIRSLNIHGAKCATTAAALTPVKSPPPAIPCAANRNVAHTRPTKTR